MWDRGVDVSSPQLLRYYGLCCPWVMILTLGGGVEPGDGEFGAGEGPWGGHLPPSPLSPQLEAGG